MKMMWRWPYNDYDVGFWGKPTVTINFCEEVSWSSQIQDTHPANGNAGLCRHLLLCGDMQRKILTGPCFLFTMP